MKHHSYRDRDHAFGQIMLTLRSAMKLTQAQLAEVLNVSSRAVGDWEAGVSYPKVERLKQFIALAVMHHAFHTGQEAEEIRALWKAANQKVLLNEMWLADLLSNMPLKLTKPANEPFHDPSHAISSPARGRRVDWADAITARDFFGREWELARLTGWVLQEHCRVISLLGMGGIGKSALSAILMRQVAQQFDVVIWRSLRDAPTCESLLDSCLQVLAPQPHSQALVDLEQRLNLLIEYLRGQRALVVLDNLETLLEEGADTGYMRSGYEGYEKLIRRVGETEHQSCLLFTSREKPICLTPLEGTRSYVRILRLTRLESKSCEQLLAEKGVAGSNAERARLIDIYTGNPLALKIVAQTIVDLFEGEIAPFLAQGETIFGGIRTLLAEQFARLSALEQSVLMWLAIMREPSSLDDLLAVIVMPVPRARLLEAIESLHRRSLVERGQQRGSFVLHSVVLEYVTSKLVEEAEKEIRQGTLVYLIDHGLELAQVPEYVRQTKQRLILRPILFALHSVYRQQSKIEDSLSALLAQLKTWEENRQGYGPANLVVLLRLLRGDLRGVDLSHLVLRDLYLQDVEMQDARLVNATIQDSVFTEVFDALTGVAISSTGEHWAAASRRGELRIWEADGKILRRAWRGHTSTIWALAFSPNGQLLASGCNDGSVKLWEVHSGKLLWSSRHAGDVNRLSFSPDGLVLAGAGDGDDCCVYLWHVASGNLFQTIPHPHSVASVIWSPDGHLLASGDLAGHVHLWATNPGEPATHLQTLIQHTHCADGLAFAPDSRSLASASWDGTVNLWEVSSGRLIQTLTGHTDRVVRVVWSPDGTTLASSGVDQTILLWDVDKPSYRVALKGHVSHVYDLVFTPDSRSLLSSGRDRTLRVWDVESERCMHVIHGYAASIYDVDWSPDGSKLVSGGTDLVVTVWDAYTEARLQVLHEHIGVVRAVGWSPNGRWLASSDAEYGIRLWDLTSSESFRFLRHSDNSGNYLYGVAWSPDGQHLASGSHQHGITIWDVITGKEVWSGRQFSTWFPVVVWSPDGTRLAGGGVDGNIYVWNVADDRLEQQLVGHRNRISSLAWSPDGTRLASGASSPEAGELYVWSLRDGERIQSLVGHVNVVAAVAWDSSGKHLISGGGQGILRWWDVEAGKLLWVCEAHNGTIQSLRRSPDGTKLASCGDDGAIMLWDLDSGEYRQTLRPDRPYERLDITGIKGLTTAKKATLRALGAIENGTAQSFPLSWSS